MLTTTTHELPSLLDAMTRLHDFNRRLLSGNELSHFFEELLEATVELHEADFGAIHSYDPKRDRFKLVVQRGLRPALVAHFEKPDSAETMPCVRALAQGQRIVIEDVETDPSYSNLREAAAEAGYRAVQSTPLLTPDGELTGVLSTLFVQPWRPTPRVLRLTDLYVREAMESVARTLALHHAQFLSELSHTVSSLAAPSAILSRASEMIGEHLGADRCCIGERLGSEAVVADDWSCADFPRISGRYLAASLCSPRLWTALIEQPLGIDDRSTHPLTRECGAGYEFLGIRSVAIAPLLREGECIAFIFVTTDRLRHWSREELNLLQQALTRVWPAVERARTQEASKVSQLRLAEHTEALERHVAERTVKLQETVADLELFSYSISHDMRAPVRAMHSFARLLQEETESEVTSRSRDYIQRIITASERLDRLIQDVLAYSSMAQAEIPVGPVNLENLLEGLLDSYIEFREPHALIEIRRPLPWVRGHEAALTQCLSNLIGNGVKFSKPGLQPRVEIWAERHGARIRIYVKDHGIGIDPQYHQKIFNLFYQHDPATDGTGIGLMVARKAAEKMNGELGVESRLGEGSVFHLELDGAEP